MRLRFWNELRKSGADQGARLFGQFGEFIEQLQRRAADYLARKTQYWNKGSWIIALAIFCLLFGGCCFWLILKAVL